MRWLLPEHIDDILPEEAMRIELLRRSVLDLFFKYRYELVIPPLLEHLERRRHDEDGGVIDAVRLHLAGALHVDHEHHVARLLLHEHAPQRAGCVPESAALVVVRCLRCCVVRTQALSAPLTCDNPNTPHNAQRRNTMTLWIWETVVAQQLRVQLWRQGLHQ